MSPEERDALPVPGSDLTYGDLMARIQEQVVALEAAIERAQWLPIETAPREIDILGWNSWGYILGQVREDGVFEDDNCVPCLEDEHAPTHWVPLLEGPA